MFNEKWKYKKTSQNEKPINYYQLLAITNTLLTYNTRKVS